MKLTHRLLGNTLAIISIVVEVLDMYCTVCTRCILAPQKPDTGSSVLKTKKDEILMSYGGDVHVLFSCLLLFLQNPNHQFHDF